MFKSIIIGNLGADAETKSNQGQDFTVFRVAHTDRYTGQDGVVHESTDWVDCAMNGRPPVAQYLKKGTTVCVIGDSSLRVYSSPKLHRMVAGLRLNVRSVELIGGRPDGVPTRLYDSNGVEHVVNKYYHTDLPSANLMSRAGALFVTDVNGWVAPVYDDAQQADAAADADNQQHDAAADAAQPSYDAPFTGDDNPEMVNMASSSSSKTKKTKKS